MRFITRFANKELLIENKILCDRINKLEKNIDEPFLRGFNLGVEKTLDLLPLMSQTLQQAVRSRAISETLERFNGNNKTVH